MKFDYVELSIAFKFAPSRPPELEGKERAGLESDGHADTMDLKEGQIIAYRPAERVSQVASHVLNKESFLFKVSNSESNSDAVVMKLVYEHFGYSHLKDDVLSKTPTLQLSVRRDVTCDETYGAFLQNSPTLGNDQVKNDSSEKVIFIGPFQEMKISPEQPLKCYRLPER